MPWQTPPSPVTFLQEPGERNSDSRTPAAGWSSTELRFLVGLLQRTQTFFNSLGARRRTTRYLTNELVVRQVDRQRGGSREGFHGLRKSNHSLAGDLIERKVHCLDARFLRSQSLAQLRDTDIGDQVVIQSHRRNRVVDGKQLGDCRAS